MSAPRRDKVKDDSRIWRRSSTTTEIKTAPVEEQFQIDKGETLRDMALDLGLSCGTVQHRDECCKNTVSAVTNGTMCINWRQQRNKNDDLPPFLQSYAVLQNNSASSGETWINHFTNTS
jgi:hypothetical protein